MIKGKNDQAIPFAACWAGTKIRTGMHPHPAVPHCYTTQLTFSARPPAAQEAGRLLLHIFCILGLA